MSFTFGPDVRLRTSDEFDAVHKRGRRVGAKYLTVLGHPNGLGRDRLGLVASRRMGGAVVRNKAKRRLRELFRLRLAPTPGRLAEPALDLVVIVRRECAAATFAAIDTDFCAAVGRLRQTRHA